MKVYELMNLLGQMRADQDVNIGAALSISEIVNYRQVDEDVYVKNFEISYVCIEDGKIYI